MATGDLITRPIQFETRGLLIGDGTQLEFSDEGMPAGFGVPASRAARVPRPRQHGTRPVRQYLDEMILTWTMHVAGDNVDDALALLQQIGAAWAPLTDGGNVELAMRFGTDTYLAIGQPGRTSTDITAIDSAIPDVTVEWCATDPRLFSAGADVIWPAALLVTSGGLSFPHGFPHGFGAAYGRVDTAHAGNVPTPWKATIVPGASTAYTDPSLTLLSTGERLEIDLVLDPGDTLELDSRERTVLLNGVADRSYAISRPNGDHWFEIPPADDTVVLGGSGDGGVLFSYRAAYLF